MKYTLLEMVQIILSALESDEVNDISDSTESYSIAVLIRSCFYDMAVELNLPEHKTLFELNASGDNTKPTLMTLPSDVAEMTKVMYDVQETGDTYQDHREIEYMVMDEFLELVESLREETSNVGSMDVTMNGESFPFLYRTNKHPEFFTTADDNQLIFDSHDSTVDTTLQKSKTMCFGTVYPTFTLSNNFVADLDIAQFQLLLNKSKTRAFAEVKQTQNVESAGQSRRLKIVAQKRKRATPDRTELQKVPNYGRK